MQYQRKAALAPYVPYSVTDLAAVVSLRRWTNLKVKVVGILCTVDGVKRTVALHEVGIPHNPVSIMSGTVLSYVSEDRQAPSISVPSGWSC